jgi:hypothetical protein
VTLLISAACLVARSGCALGIAELAACEGRQVPGADLKLRTVAQVSDPDACEWCRGKGETLQSLAVLDRLGKSLKELHRGMLVLQLTALNLLVEQGVRPTILAVQRIDSDGYAWHGSLLLRGTRGVTPKSRVPGDREGT